MAYIISGLEPSLFTHLHGLSDAELAEHQAIRRVVAEGEALPARVGLRDAPPGSTVLLVNYAHLPTRNPYRSSYAIFVEEGDVERAEFRDAVPEMLASRLISLRAFDADDMLVAADVVPGERLEDAILGQLALPEVLYLHAHFAKQGCYAALVSRS